MKEEILKLKDVETNKNIDLNENMWIIAWPHKKEITKREFDDVFADMAYGLLQEHWKSFFG